MLVVVEDIAACFDSSIRDWRIKSTSHCL